MCGKMVFMKSLVIVNMLGKSYILGTNGNDFKIQQLMGKKAGLFTFHGIYNSCLWYRLPEFRWVTNHLILQLGSTWKA